MLKKFLIVLLLLLSACGKQAEDTIIDEQYIAPVMDVFLFGELDANTKADIKKANGNKDYSNRQFKMLGLDAYQNDLVDLEGNVINLNSYSRYVLEVVSVECSHCKKFIGSHLEEMLAKDETLIQYFNVGDKNTIEEFYKDLGMAIPENLIIIPSDDGLHEYIKSYLNVETYPSLLSFVDNKLSFVGTGEYDSINMDYFYNISFNKRLTNLVDKSGNDLLSLLRDVDDVRNDVSIENQNKIASIDTDQSTIEASYKIMGSTCDFDKISNDKSQIYMNEIDDYSIYKDKNLVLFYTYLRGDEKDDERIDFINSLIASNDDYEYIVVLTEGLDSSSNFYKQSIKKYNCPCVSVLGYIPDDFYKIGLTAFPSAFFIRKGTFTGAYSNVENVENFNIALDIFLSDNCVALIRNN